MNKIGTKTDKTSSRGYQENIRADRDAKKTQLNF